MTAPLVERLRHPSYTMPSGGLVIAPDARNDMNEAAAEIERYRRGIKEIGEHLSRPSPRVGDASFIVEALLAE